MDLVMAPPEPALAARLAQSAQGPASLAPTSPTAFAPSRPPPLPVAVVAVPVLPGRLGSLRPYLLSLARSRSAGDVPAAPGALAVLVLAAEDGALAVAEAVAPDLPFPLRVEPGPGDTILVVRRAAAWAETLGIPGAPVLIGDVREPAAPRWAHAALASLRDGADLVTRRAVPWWRPLTRPAAPVALSGRAQGAMERWCAAWPARRGAAWTERGSPWMRPALAGLRSVPLHAGR